MLKEFIFKNKKIVCIGLVALSILFLILIIANLSSAEREAYQAMYDANCELYDAYIDTAEKFDQYGQSSKAQTCYSKAYELDDKIERYGKELSSLNIQVAVLAVFMIGSIIGVILLLKKKESSNLLVEDLKTNSSSPEEGIL